MSEKTETPTEEKIFGRIPVDPRNRTKNQGRLTMTLWVDAPEGFSGPGGNAMDFMREMIDTTMDAKYLAELTTELNGKLEVITGHANVLAGIDLTVSK